MLPLTPTVYNKNLVPVVGIEPTCRWRQSVLSAPCIPVPPYGQNLNEYLLSSLEFELIANITYRQFQSIHH